jgi:site-specific DNA-methyltransferase (adenine-specific)
VMGKIKAFENQILLGDCLKWLEKMPEGCIDLIFADPPYNLQLKGDLWRPNMTRVDAVEESWDQFNSFQHYDEFSQAWLSACRRVLKEDGTLWVIGSYHNIFRLGKIIQDLGYWILNDVLWIKTNPMPNFRGVRLTNAHETLIWAAKSKDAKYTFNHHAMKALNEGKQMRSDWYIPICSGEERVKTEGRKAHPTQKPEALLYRVILSSSQPGDLVLDPFFGMGTTGVVAKKLHRHWIGIEREAGYVELAQARINKVIPEPYEEQVFDVRDHKRLAPRIAFTRLLEHGLLQPGEKLYFKADIERVAVIRPDGKLLMDGFEGSIHQVGRHLSEGAPCNGWEHWYYQRGGELNKIDVLREVLRRM